MSSFYSARLPGNSTTVDDVRGLQSDIELCAGNEEKNEGSAYNIGGVIDLDERRS